MLRNVVRSFLICIACWLIPSIAKADTPIPTSIVTNYDAALKKLTVTVQWYWSSTASNKFITAAMFVDLNGDGIMPTVFDNPATYTSGGNAFPAGLSARDEFLGQLAISSIEGTATSSVYPSGDRTDNGIASAVSGVTTSTPRVLFPYGLNSIDALNSTTGTFTLTYTNVVVAPTKTCLVMYDAHTPLTSSGSHSVMSSTSNRNSDNSVEDGNDHGTVSCSGLVNLNCAVDKTEAACQTQTAINTSYNAWLASVTASGCSGTLSNNSTGTPAATGGSKTVTFTYHQTACSNQATNTTCTATFTVSTCTTGSIGDRVWYDTDMDGIQDASENGIQNVTVKLRNSSNVVIATDVTDASGNYLFTGLNAGSYTVEFPSTVFGYKLSPAFVGANRAIDSDPSVTTGITPVITLATSENNTGVDAGYSPDCSCVNSPSNLLVNGSFENGTTGWSWSSANGSLTTGTGYIACGSANGFNNQSSGTSKVWQDVAILAGATATFSAYAGTHTGGIGCSPTLSLIFLNAANTVLGQSNVTVTRDVDINSSQLEQYTLSGVAPVGTTKVRVQSSITCNTMKMDAFCLTVIPPPAITNPDFNSTYVNVPVPGNVSTNDIVPAGTTYGTSPALVSSPAGSTPVLTMNSNGTYSFVSDKPGVYTYNVPVCVPGAVAPCPPTALVITVLDGNTDKNAPVANVDIATTNINTAVTLKTLINDAAGNAITALVPSSVTVTIAPLHGTTSINPATGDNTYTPAAGYTGTDTLTYQVCDNQTPAKCATAKQIITIKPSAGANTTAAADDYKITDINVPATGNVKTNDTDPEGNTQTVTAQPGTIVAGKGTLVLAADGSYTFTPVTGYSGPVDFPYTTCDNGVPVACATATLHILVRPEVPVTNPDFNSTYVNVPVPGNVSTNDKVPAGTTYGTTPTLVSSPAGSTPVLTMNSNGTYSFVTDKPGVYTYNVPVCIPGQVAPCPPTALVITVLDNNTDKNAPVANVDIATTKINTPVTLKSLANDAAGNAITALVPSSVTVTVAPLHGTTSVNPANGDITYTPAAGYVGTDTLTYQVCDNQTPAKCATAKQIITIRPAVSPNTTAAADDYQIVPINTAGTGNVKTNDTDPEGNTQTVTVQPGTTVAGKGTLVLAADGSYTFTPVTGYSGPVDFPYTTCDNGTPQACATATLHIIVRPEVPVTNPDFNSTYVNVPVPGNVSTNDKVPAGTTYGTTPTLVSSPAGSTPVLTMNSNGTYSFVTNTPGVYTYNVPVCLPGQVAPCPPTALVITVLDGSIFTNPPVANVDIATTKMGVPVTLKTLVNDAAGNVTTALVPSTVTVTVAPLHGTTIVNAANGDITYTPAAGYVGTDTLTYQVCDNQTPAKCATAKQIITIRPTVSPNTTTAADDYVITGVNTAATGNVKTNDSDPEGNTQTVTAQPGTTVAGKGTLVLAADGSYTFTPVTGYSGPVDFPYTTCDNGVPVACATATLHILVRPEVPVTNPDFNSTLVNIPVPGNVNTNDKVPAGTTYGTSPTLVSSPAGSTPTLTMNSNGSYIFVSNLPGVYTYNVPVCVPGQVAPCPTTALVITILDGGVITNPPVANVDIATTKINTPVTLKTLANDAAGNASSALAPASVAVTVAPLHGTTNVNPANGDITYTPAAGYVGTDTLTYQVCDNQAPPKCATAKQIITIRPANAPNTTAAADDYVITPLNTAVSGNVKINDTDPEGNTQTVTPQTTVIPGKGNLVLAADGSYTFTSVTGFAGPVDFPYTTCDNGVPQACASATLHILVKPAVPVPDLTPNITVTPNIMHGTTQFNVTVRVTELLTIPTNGSEILVRIPRDPRVSFTFNQAATQIGFTPVNNSVWTYDGSDPFFHIFRTSSVIAGNTFSTFGFNATFIPGQSRGKYTLTSSLNSGSGGEINTQNNQDAEVLDYFID